MVVVPTDEQVELSYGREPIELFAYLMTLVGLVGLVWLARRPPVVVAAPEPDATEPDATEPASEPDDAEPASAGPSWPSPPPEKLRHASGGSASWRWCPRRPTSACACPCRSEERSVGKEWVIPLRAWWSPYH